jgi:RHS repeat-associated protein
VVLRTEASTLTFGYDASGLETRRELPDGIVLEQDWDPLGRLTSQTLVAGPHIRQRRGYTYRADGYLERLDDQLTGSREFRLDALGRVTESHGRAWAERYSYDPAGNVASAAWPAPPSGPDTDWLTGDVQGPRSRAGTRVTRAGSVSYRYDACGRVVCRRRKSREWRYEWDADDRLTAVTMPDGSTWRYTYDPFGRRIAKQHADSGRSVSFTWEGPLLIEQASDAGAITWDYKPGSFTPVTQVTDAEFHAIVTDLTGTPRELVSADGRLAGHQQHTLWGGTIWRGADTPLRFPGQYADPETGLHYNTNRYYDPVTGSYLTPDPLGLAPAPNPHAYVPNPHVFTDPLGLMCKSGETGGGRDIDPIKPGKNFRDHFINHKSLLQQVTGSSYRTLAEGGPRFLGDLTEMVRNGDLSYEGVGTLNRDAALAMIYRGKGLTLSGKAMGGCWFLIHFGRMA